MCVCVLLIQGLGRDSLLSQGERDYVNEQWNPNAEVQGLYIILNLLFYIRGLLF